eukprot:CAMPEP_0182448628 /NCGR_PEP_ID=MMETSP1172-20130603/28489_1 /TAXON_ID=708627 /ORGANISM="Timspurckia oligopyrenoides, Strain CCMP3278" /LENGTH=708 /DNA_ID=CAMNT_0024645565 /DNA_START=73 /DNA_END=2196 /DNA_ORIENTATION=+
MAAWEGGRNAEKVEIGEHCCIDIQLVIDKMDMDSAPHIVNVACSTLNQWAMDFEGNYLRLRRSIVQARRAGVRYRVGGELEVCGYGCEDHFLEIDTYTHCWEVLAKLLDDEEESLFDSSMLVDIGMPVLHRGVSYNCRILILDRKIVLIRPKMWLADDGNYREPRWFRAWPNDRKLEMLQLPEIISKRINQKEVPIGNAVLSAADCSLAIETCEELFTPEPPHLQYALLGVQLVSNGSGSHHALRKLSTRLDLICSATRKLGGAYLYANLIGCDGSRVYYDGCSMVVVNGAVLAQGEQFCVYDEVLTTFASIELDSIARYRGAMASRGVQAADVAAQHDVKSLGWIELKTADGKQFYLCEGDCDGKKRLAAHCDVSSPVERVRLYCPEEEIALGPACWLWDYLRRSGMRGYLLPLSGGADSASTATIAYSMCVLLHSAVQQELAAARDGSHIEYSVLNEMRRLARKDSWLPETPQEICSEFLTTVYLGSAPASSQETRQRAASLATAIGSRHANLDIWPVVSALQLVFGKAFGGKNGSQGPRFRAHGGEISENIALQNMQARIRMVIAYMCAQLVPWATGSSGTLLVLGSSNVDEALRGYLTKYDCSSADVNPIGGISKSDLRLFLKWAATEKDQNASKGGLGLGSSVSQIVDAVPTAELEPTENGITVQTDEADMGMTYDELTVYGRLRKLQHCGPVSMYFTLLRTW